MDDTTVDPMRNDFLGILVDLDEQNKTLLAEVSRLRAERDALAAEVDRDRHEFEPSRGPFGCCGNDREAAAIHRTSRVVLAEQTVEDIPT